MRINIQQSAGDLPAWGQPTYPSQPVRFVIAFGAGGVADATARLVAEKLGGKLGQRVVVENIPGGGGMPCHPITRLLT